uniref:Uncharacterized protein n=1 Tax=Rhizophora mucronata TaxID=61149 RepID=A0A2P2QZB4_RHIMU
MLIAFLSLRRHTTSGSPPRSPPTLQPQTLALPLSYLKMVGATEYKCFRDSSCNGVVREGNEGRNPDPNNRK